jgi:hypothetical protein
VSALGFRGNPREAGSRRSRRSGEHFRFIALFETSAPWYDWINRIVAVGIGERLADGPLYNVFEVL